LDINILNLILHFAVVELGHVQVGYGYVWICCKSHAIGIKWFCVVMCGYDARIMLLE
jgi:hypothetical protein